MKRKFMKKALAVALSASMAFSMSSAVSMETASAAAKFVRLNTTYKTLKVGQKDYKLKLVNNTLKWKIKKASTTNKKIATVYGKKASYVLLKGKSEGRATIKLNLKTSARKKNNTKTLRCRVNVVPASSVKPGTDPGQTTPVQTSAVAGTQAELDAALANPALTEITIRTNDSTSFVIPSGSHSSTDLIIDAPNASMTNSGVFRSVTIENISSNTWTEKASNNAFKVSASTARIVVDEGAKVTSVAVVKADADIKIETKGTLAGITISAKAKVTLSGTSASLIPVSIDALAAGAEFISSVPVAVQTAADATIELQANAEKSTVDISNNNAVVTVKNNTNNYAVPVTRGTSKRTVSKGTQTLKPSTSQSGSVGYIPGTGSGSWGGGGSSYYPSEDRKDNAKVATNVTDLEKWLKDSDVTKLTIKTSNEWANKEITIPDGTYNMDLVVDAANETVNNYGKFNSVTIKNIASDTFNEWAHGNSLTVTAPNPHIVVGKGVYVDRISFGNSNPNNPLKKVKLDIKGNVGRGVAFTNPVTNADVNVEEGASVAGGIALQKSAEASNIKLSVAGSISGEVKCAAGSANLTMTIENENASVERVSVTSGMNVLIKAAEAVKNLLKPIEVILNSNVSAKLTAAVKVSVTVLKKDAEVVLQKGADGSDLTYGSDVDSVGINTEVDITAKKQGSNETATIPADTKGSVSIDGGEVAVETIKPTGIELNSSNLTLTTGTSEDLTISLIPASASAKITASEWTPAKEGVISIKKAENDETAATLTAVSAGETVLHVSATTDSGNTFETEITVTVQDPDTPNTPSEDETKTYTFTLTADKTSIKAGETAKVTAALTPPDDSVDLSNVTVTWTSSNTSAATVSGSALTATVTGVAAGESTITATATIDEKEVTGTTSITVTAADGGTGSDPTTPGGDDNTGDNPTVPTITVDSSAVTLDTVTGSGLNVVSPSAFTIQTSGIKANNNQITVEGTPTVPDSNMTVTEVSGSGYKFTLTNQTGGTYKTNYTITASDSKKYTVTITVTITSVSGGTSYTATASAGTATAVTNG